MLRGHAVNLKDVIAQKQKGYVTYSCNVFYVTNFVAALRHKYTISVEGSTADATESVAVPAAGHYEGSSRDKYYLLLWLISK